MGEYAKFSGKEIKIGTCESMYYLRWEDRARVQPLPGNVRPASDQGLFWRLPFPDEDKCGPGGYEQYNRGARLWKKRAHPNLGHDDFEDATLIQDPGIIQLRHAESGLLLNVPCYHGIKLPEVQEPMRAFWNGKGHSLELIHVKNTPDHGLKPIIGCRHCRKMWRFEWDEVLPWVGDQELRYRLQEYAKHSTREAAAA